MHRRSKRAALYLRRGFWFSSRWSFRVLGSAILLSLAVLWVLPGQFPVTPGCAGSISALGVECAGFAGAETVETTLNAAFLAIFVLPVVGADCLLGGDLCDYFGIWYGAFGVAVLAVYAVAAMTPARWLWRQWVGKKP